MLSKFIASIKHWLKEIINSISSTGDQKDMEKNQEGERYDHLIASTKKHEGQVKKGGSHVVYDDATGEVLDTGDTIEGKPTVGSGRNLVDRGLDDEEVEYLLKNDLESFEKRCESHLNDLWGDLNGPRKNVLVEMAFNMGVSGLLSFKNMLNSLREGNYSEASKEMLDSKWADQVGYRANTLSTQMEIGEYQVN